MQAKKCKKIKIENKNDKKTSEENIRNNTYPVTECFYAVYRSDNPNENVQLLINWILSDEAQLIIDETGYINLER